MRPFLRIPSDRSLPLSQADHPPLISLFFVLTLCFSSSSDQRRIQHRLRGKHLLRRTRYLYWLHPERKARLCRSASILLVARWIDGVAFTHPLPLLMSTERQDSQQQGLRLGQRYQDQEWAPSSLSLDSHLDSVILSLTQTLVLPSPSHLQGHRRFRFRRHLLWVRLIDSSSHLPFSARPYHKPCRWMS